MSAEILSLPVGAGILFAGIMLGRYLPARARGPKPKEPLCACRHHLAYHVPAGDGAGGACDHQEYIGLGQYVGCSCRQYSGPRVLDPGYVAREIAGD